MDVESSDSSEDSEDARDEDFEGIIEGPGPSRPLKGHQPRKKKVSSKNYGSLMWGLICVHRPSSTAIPLPL